MSETAPSTPTAPGTEIVPIAPVPDSNELHIDPVRLVSEQIFEDADRRGRPDLVGLWLRDRDGQVYEVTDCDTFGVKEPETEKTRLPRLEFRGHLKGGPTIRKKQKTVSAPEEVSLWIIKVSKNNVPVDLVSVARDDKLADYLDFPGEQELAPLEWGHLKQRLKKEDKASPPVIFTAFGWKDAEPRPGTHDYEIPLKIDDTDKSVFDAIMENQEQHGLPNWIGLSWMLNDDRQRITEDVVLTPGTDGDEHPVRAWAIKTYNNKGDEIYQHVYKDAALQKYIESVAKSWKDLHWEVPKPLPELTTIKALGRGAARFVAGPVDHSDGPTDLGEVPEVADSPTLSDENAIQLLSYVDVLIDEGARQAMIAEVKASPEGQEYKKILQKLVIEHGLDAVRELATQLYETFQANARKLRLPITPRGRSISWAIRDLAEQRYAAEHADEVEVARQHDDFGIKVGDPFGDTDEARRKKREIMDHHMGLELAGAVLLTTPGKKVLTKNKKGDDVVAQLPDTYKIDVKVLEALQLQASIKPQVLEILYATTRDGKELGWMQFVQLGRQLQRSIGQ